MHHSYCATVVRGDVFVPRFLLHGLKIRRRLTRLRVVARPHVSGRNNFRAISVTLASTDRAVAEPSGTQKTEAIDDTPKPGAVVNPEANLTHTRRKSPQQTEDRPAADQSKRSSRPASSSEGDNGGSAPVWIVGLVTSVGVDFVIVNEDIFVPGSLVESLPGGTLIRRGETRLRVLAHPHRRGRNNWRASQIQHVVPTPAPLPQIVPSTREGPAATSPVEELSGLEHHHQYFTTAFMGAVTGVFEDGSFLVNQTIHVPANRLGGQIPAEGMWCWVQVASTPSGPHVVAAQLHHYPQLQAMMMGGAMMMPPQMHVMPGYY